MSDTAVIALVIVLVGGATALTVRVIIKNKSMNSSRKTVQKGNMVGGDQAGGDIHKGS